MIRFHSGHGDAEAKHLLMLLKALRCLPARPREAWPLMSPPAKWLFGSFAHTVLMRPHFPTCAGYPQWTQEPESCVVLFSWAPLLFIILAISVII